jgi:hypothetical protein
MEADHQLIITGNLFVYGGGVPVVNTIGNYNVSTQYTVPVQAQGIATGGSSLSTADIAAAVIAAMNLNPPSVNMAQVNGQLIQGTGTEANPWGPE